MESGSTSTVLSENFRMPSEPHPLPSLGSDEESFVILGNSLSPDVDAPSTEIFDPPSVVVIEEAKKLLSNEISLLEQMSLDKKTTNASGNAVQSQTQISQSQCEPIVEAQSSSTDVHFDVTSSLHGMEQPAIFEMRKSLLNSFPELKTYQKWSLDDLPPEEVQQKISQIIQENVDLKDTLLQNNMSLKSQFERIEAWQEDVQKVHQAHRLKLVKAKEFIDTLKAENVMLNRQMDKSNELAEKQKKEIASLKLMLEESKRLADKKIIQTSDNNLKEFELDAACKKNKDLETKVQNLLAENSLLKEEKTRLELNDNAGKSAIEKLVVENTFLKNENLKLKDYAEKSRIDMEQIEQKCVQLEIELEKSQQNLAEKKEHPNINVQLYNDLQSRISPEVRDLRTQLASTQTMLTQVKQSNAAAYAQIGAMQNQMRDASNEVESLKSQHNNEIYALQTQLEIFKADFEAEKESKNNIKHEKDRLAEDLQCLQRRNQQLQAEIEVARDNHEYVVYPNHNPRSTGATNELKKCPKCSFGFVTMQALENHVHRCLELDDNLP